MKPPLHLLLTAMALSAGHDPACADPMRPLAVPGKAPVAASAPTPAASRVSDAPRPLERLIAIRQDSQGRMQALIGERWVGVGDTLGAVSVMAIGNNQVDLKTGKVRSTVHLLPPLQASAETTADRAVLALTDRGPSTRTAGSPTR